MTIDDISVLPADQVAARVLAHTLLEQTQVTTPQPLAIAGLAQQAAANGWSEVHVVLLHCLLIAHSLQDDGYETIRDCSNAMLGAAEGSGDEILIALALAARAVFVVHADHPESLREDVGDLLARASAMLDDVFDAGTETLGPRAAELPAAYVEIGQALHRLNLWELEEEMYAHAAVAVDLPLPAVLSPIPNFTRRALVINRLEAAAALACALLEIGDRRSAEAVAAHAVRPTPAERSDMSATWAHEILALEHFLDVVAGRVLPMPAGLYESLSESTWTGYRAALLLADALIAHDRGQSLVSSALAELATTMLDDYKPSMLTYALHLAAASGPRRSPSARYARELATMRWQTRMSVLGAFRSRMAAARVLRQGEALNRQANVDALTGLANRHAETRHLARLRRRDPAERLAVVLVDVDHFKAVNDTFGHAVGDAVLQVIGSVLQSAVRASDLAVRLGGDEFMLLIDLPPGGDRPVIADEIVRAVTLHHWNEVVAGLRVSVSAGQAIGAARDVDDLVRAADAHLYRAKAAGRGRAAV